MLASQAIFARRHLHSIILPLVSDYGVPLSALDRAKVTNEVQDEVFGLGPLDPLLQDPTVGDIYVNSRDAVYVERGGTLEKTDVTFRDNTHLRQIVDRIATAVGRRADESSPVMDARLPDGSRIKVIMPPLAMDGPILSIRRFHMTPLTADDRSEEHTSELQSLRH